MPWGPSSASRIPLGNVSHVTYDSRDQVTQTTDPLGHTTESTYDGNGNLLTFEDGRGNTTQFGYDLRNRVSSKTDPLTKDESYEYDAIGNRTRVTDREGQVSSYGYDFLDRMISAGFGATTANPTAFTSTVTYTWDAGNRLTDAVDSVSGTVARDFDGLDRLIEEVSPQGQINYAYYANGLRQTMTVQGQPSVSYSYDDASRLTQISQGSATVGLAYDSIDRRTKLTLPSGIEITYGYDDANQLTNLIYQNGSVTIGNLTYGYDAAGRRTSMGGSLAQVNLPTTVSSSTHNGGNRVTTWGSQVLTYDDNGALTADAGATALAYVWDERRRLKQIQQGGTTIASFQYDAFNRRIGKTVNGVNTNFLNDGWQVVQELTGTTPSANLLTGLRIDEIFRRAAGATIEDFLTDALGSTIALVDAAGAVQANYTYEPYGGTVASGSASGNAYQYTGRDNDGGLYYYRNRYYSPTLHRFVSEDPIGLAAGSNVYAYVRGNPIRFSDPFGLEEDDSGDDSKPLVCDPVAANDAEAQRSMHEIAADAARRRGDWEEYYDQMYQAYRWMWRWYRRIAQPIPFDPPPRGPVPPSATPPPGIPDPTIEVSDIFSGPPPKLND
jgi:RHS repeat-associated protein